MGDAWSAWDPASVISHSDLLFAALPVMLPVVGSKLVPMLLKVPHDDSGAKHEAGVWQKLAAAVS